MNEYSARAALMNFKKILDKDEDRLRLEIHQLEVKKREIEKELCLIECQLIAKRETLAFLRDLRKDLTKEE